LQQGGGKYGVEPIIEALPKENRVYLYQDPIRHQHPLQMVAKDCDDLMSPDPSSLPSSEGTQTLLQSEGVSISPSIVYRVNPPGRLPSHSGSPCCQDNSPRLPENSSPAIRFRNRSSHLNERCKSRALIEEDQGRRGLNLSARMGRRRCLCIMVGDTRRDQAQQRDGEGAGQFGTRRGSCSESERPSSARGHCTIDTKVISGS